MPPPKRVRDGGVQSVDRAVSILELLASAGATGVTEIASQLQISKSTAFRLLMTLEARGLVHQGEDRGKYGIGYTAVGLAAGAAKMQDMATLSRTACRELASAVGETINVAVRDGSEVMTVYQERGDAALTTIDWVGRRQPLHVTAVGKIFLAEMSYREVESVISSGLKAYTEATITDPEELRGQLEQIRQAGYAVTYEEYEVGLVAVAMPIRALNEDVVAAVTISGPTFRVNEQSMPHLLSVLGPAADQISWRAGYVKRG